MDLIKRLPIELQQHVYSFDSVYRDINNGVINHINLMFTKNKYLEFKKKYQPLMGLGLYYIHQESFRELCRVISVIEKFDVLPNSLILSIPKVLLYMKLQNDGLNMCSHFIEKMRDYTMLTQNLYYEEFESESDEESEDDDV